MKHKVLFIILSLVMQVSMLSGIGMTALAEQELEEQVEVIQTEEVQDTVEEEAIVDGKQESIVNNIDSSNSITDAEAKVDTGKDLTEYTDNDLLEIKNDQTEKDNEFESNDLFSQTKLLELKTPTKLTIIDGIYYYEIYDISELAYIADAEGDWLTYNYILMNDITLNDINIQYDSNGKLITDQNELVNWTPIDGFEGIFDGNNFKISGVFIDSDAQAGFFTSFKGDIKNLSIVNSYVSGVDDVGGIIGGFYNVGGTIENCSFSGAVIGNNNVGGILGRNSCTTISKCENYGNIWGTGDYVAGIVGYFSAYGIDNCVNYGIVSGGGKYTGGIAGYSSIYGIDNCYNYGKIQGTDYTGGILGYATDGVFLNTCGNNNVIGGNDHVGGICGFLDSSQIINCYNLKNINGNNYIGGLSGDAREKSSFGSLNVSDSYSVGDINGNENAGAIIGYTQSVWGKGTVKSCYYLKSTNINHNLNGFGNGVDFVGIVESEAEGFFPICENSNADPAYKYLRYPCTLSYDVNGGDELINNKKSIFNNKEIGDLITPTRSGYNFIGWYTSSYEGDLITASTLGKKDMVAYAHWDKASSKQENDSSMDSDEESIKFKDIVPGKYYETSVKWAVSKGITTGTSSTTFSPNDPCTRGQVVTFLWRAFGSPEPSAASNKFSDVSSSKYYYKAVLWAAEQGITTGTSSTTFSPNDTVTRGQFVTFLYRAVGQPDIDGGCKFTDVKSTKFYYNAVIWAANSGVTTGTSSTTFSPNDPCTRGQVVTFIYRAMN